MKFMNSKANDTLYLVGTHTLNKMKNYRNIELHDVLEQNTGYNFVFSYKYFDDDGKRVTGYKTLWQDRDQDEVDIIMDEIITELRKKQNDTTNCAV